MTGRAPRGATRAMSAIVRLRVSSRRWPARNVASVIRACGACACVCVCVCAVRACVRCVRAGAAPHREDGMDIVKMMCATDSGVAARSVASQCWMRPMLPETAKRMRICASCGVAASVCICSTIDRLP